MRRVDGVGQSIPFGIQPVDVELLLADQVHQPRRVTAPDLAATGHPVRSAEQQPGQQAD
jgi:hypothetical protein